MWDTFHRADLVRGAVETTLKNLNTPYVDLYLIHWPIALKEGVELFPTDAAGKFVFSDADFVDTWKEMEKAVDDGLIKSIGVSNFNKRQLLRLLAASRFKPVVNQVECHPYLTQQKLAEFCRSQDIHITAYSPLGSPNRPWVTANDPVLLDDPKVKTIDKLSLKKTFLMKHIKHYQINALAKKYNKTTGQILIRYQIQRQHIVIPKSVTKSRIISNFNVFDFELTSEDIAEINSFECNGRVCPETK